MEDNIRLSSVEEKSVWQSSKTGTRLKSLQKGFFPAAIDFLVKQIKR
jgi:hypothetical protein